MNTPSIGIDQSRVNNSVREGFIDKYYGRLPKLLHSIPEAKICVPNPEYIGLINLIIDGELNTGNISKELLNEINGYIDLLPTPWYMNQTDFALYQKYNGATTCVIDDRYVDCDALIDCAEAIYC